MPEALPPRAFSPVVPATFFGMVLGVGGLGSAWRVAARLWDLPEWIGEALALLAATVWLLWIVLFARKWVHVRAVAQGETDDPMLSFGIGLVPMATLLVAVLVKPYAPGIGWWMFAVGLSAGLAYAAWVMGRAWQGGRPIAATTPLLYLSPVGAGYLGALAAGAYGHADLAIMLWGAGAIAWLVIEAAVLQRLMMEAMPVPMRAMVGIQLAPPAVGCMSYLAITPGPPDRLALCLVGYALLQGLILLRLVGWLREQPFGPGAWSYTFGMAALAISALTMAERGMAGAMTWLAPLLFAVANAMIGWIAVRTVVLAVQGQLFPPPR